MSCWEGEAVGCFWAKPCSALLLLVVLTRLVSRRIGNLTFCAAALAALLVASTVNLEVEVLAVAAGLLVVLTFDKESEKGSKGPLAQRQRFKRAIDLGALC